jgi:hypothetical protein
MIDTEAVRPLESIRQPAIHTLGSEFLLESRLVPGIVGVRRRLELSSVTVLRIAERIQWH